MFGTLAFGTDQVVLALPVGMVRELPGAIVATGDVDLPAPWFGSGNVAPGRFDALALLAFALLFPRLVPTSIVALRQSNPTCVAASLAARRFRALRLLAALAFIAGALLLADALLSLAECLRALRLFTLRRRMAAIRLVALRLLLPSCLFALRGLQLLASRVLALPLRLRLLACIVLSSGVATSLFARRLLARLRLALAPSLRLALRALRRARLRLRPVGRFAPRGRLRAAWLLAALLTAVALAVALLRQRGQRRHQCQERHGSGLQDAAGSGLFHRRTPADTPSAQGIVLTRWQ